MPGFWATKCVSLSMFPSKANSAKPAAIQHDPSLTDDYQRLCAASKPEKVALTATMRELLVVINAMVEDQTQWGLAGVRTGISSRQLLRRPKRWRVLSNRRSDSSTASSK